MQAAANDTANAAGTTRCNISATLRARNYLVMTPRFYSEQSSSDGARAGFKVLPAVHVALNLAVGAVPAQQTKRHVMQKHMQLGDGGGSGTAATRGMSKAATQCNYEVRGVTKSSSWRRELCRRG